MSNPKNESFRVLSCWVLAALKAASFAFFVVACAGTIAGLVRAFCLVPTRRCLAARHRLISIATCSPLYRPTLTVELQAFELKILVSIVKLVMAVFSGLFSCCGSRPRRTSPDLEKYLAIDPDHHSAYHDHPTKEKLADRIVSKLLTASKNDAGLKADLQSTIHIHGWYDGLAAAVLAKLEMAIRAGEEMGPAIKSAYEQATDEVNRVEQWAGDHPEMAAVIITLIALGILAIMTPWLMACLGFAEEGIVEASWAARWQAMYRGFVPKNSLFSYLQSLGTKIGRNWQG